MSHLPLIFYSNCSSHICIHACLILQSYMGCMECRCHITKLFRYGRKISVLCTSTNHNLRFGKVHRFCKNHRILLFGSLRNLTVWCRRWHLVVLWYKEGNLSIRHLVIALDLIHILAQCMTFDPEMPLYKLYSPHKYHPKL